MPVANSCLTMATGRFRSSFLPIWWSWIQPWGLAWEPSFVHPEILSGLQKMTMFGRSQTSGIWSHAKQHLHWTWASWPNFPCNIFPRHFNSFGVDSKFIYTRSLTSKVTMSPLRVEHFSAMRQAAHSQLLALWFDTFFFPNTNLT